MNPRAFKRAYDILALASVPATLYNVDADVDVPAHVAAQTAWCQVMPPRQGEGGDTHDRYSVFVRCGAANMEIARRAAYAVHEALRGTTRSPTGFKLTQTTVDSSDGPDPVIEFYLIFRSHLRRFQA